jgi:hypothetical protein
VIDGQPLLAFTCHPDEQTKQRKKRSGLFCTWSVPGDNVLGPWDIDRAQPFTAEPELFAAPLVRQRDGIWALVGFRNLEPQGIHAFDILDPIPVRCEGGYLVADHPAEIRCATSQVSGGRASSGSGHSHRYAHPSAPRRERLLACSCSAWPSTSPVATGRSSSARTDLDGWL